MEDKKEEGPCPCRDGNIQGCSKHAQHRMCQRGITAEEIKQCQELGERRTVDKKTDAVTLGKLTIVQGRDDGTVVTAFANETKLIRCNSKDKHVVFSTLLRPGGCIESIRAGLPILCTYNEKSNAIELKGDPKNLQRAATRLEKAMAHISADASRNKGPAAKRDMPNHEVRVPAATNMTARVIGKGGKNINRLKQQCMIGHISVRWDAEEEEMVMGTKVPISDNARRKIFEHVERCLKSNAKSK